MKEINIPGKTEWGITLASIAIVARVLWPSPVEVVPITEPIPTIPVPTPTINPTATPITEVSFATRRWCNDTTINGKRDCPQEKHQ